MGDEAVEGEGQGDIPVEEESDFEPDDYDVQFDEAGKTEENEGPSPEHIACRRRVSTTARLKSVYMETLRHSPCASACLVAPLKEGDDGSNALACQEGVSAGISELLTSKEVLPTDVTLSILEEGAPHPLDARKKLECAHVLLTLVIRGEFSVGVMAEELERAVKQSEISGALRKGGVDTAQAGTGVCWPVARAKVAMDMKFRKGVWPKYPRLTEEAIAEVAPLLVDSFKGYSKIWEANGVPELEEFPRFFSSYAFQGGSDADSIFEDAALAQLQLKSELACGAMGSEQWANTAYDDRKAVSMSSPARIWVSAEEPDASCPCIPGATFFDPGIKQREDALKKVRMIKTPLSSSKGDESTLSWNRLVDLSRLSSCFHTAEKLLKGAAWVKEKFDVVTCDNKFVVPDSTGYRDITMGVRLRLAATGREHICELQMELKPMSDLKKSKGETSAEAIREILHHKCGIGRADVPEVLQMLLEELGVTEGQKIGRFTDVVRELIEATKQVFASDEEGVKNPPAKRNLRKLLYSAEKCGVSKEYLQEHADALKLGSPVAPLPESDVEARSTIFNTIFEECSADVAKAKSLSDRADQEMPEGDRSRTYGEVSSLMVNQLLDMMKTHECPLYQTDGIFLDLGSGVGKACLAAALVHPFEKVVGVEILPSLSELATFAMEKFKEMELPAGLIKPEIEFLTGDFTGVALEQIAALAPQVTVCFALATCFSEATLEGLAEVARLMKDDAVFITVGQQLPSSVVRDKKMDLTKRIAAGTRKALQVRGTAPKGTVVHVEPPAKDDQTWNLVHSDKIDMPWGPTSCFVFKKGLEPQDTPTTFLL